MNTEKQYTWSDAFWAVLVFVYYVVKACAKDGWRQVLCRIVLQVLCDHCRKHITKPIGPVTTWLRSHGIYTGPEPVGFQVNADPDRGSISISPKH